MEFTKFIWECFIILSHPFFVPVRQSHGSIKRQSISHVTPPYNAINPSPPERANWPGKSLHDECAYYYLLLQFSFSGFGSLSLDADGMCKVKSTMTEEICLKSINPLSCIT